MGKWTAAEKAAFALILLLAAVLFGQLLGVGAINWDDDSNIFKNPYYQGHLWSSFWKDSYFGLYVPVTSTIWQVLYEAGGGVAWPYRVMNLLLHLANVGLVFCALRFMAHRWSLPSVPALLIGVALFALHPLQVQAVAWISGGRDLLSAFFGLCALTLFFSRGGVVAAIAATALYAAAVLSKPNTVVLAALLPWLSFHFDRAKFRSSLWLAGAWAVVAAGSIGMTLWAQRDFLTPLHWWQRLLIMGDTYTFYLQKFFVPYPLSANYNRPPEAALATWEPWWRSAVLGVGLVAGHFLVRPKEPRFEIALSWFLLLLPVSGLVAFGYQKISTPADHYHYIPMVAMAATVMLALNKIRLPQGALIASALAILLFAVSGLRVQVWKDDAAFFANMAEYAPLSYSTGLGYSVVKCEREKDFKSGIEWTNIALAARPNDIAALANLAYCYFNSRDWPGTIALEKYLDQLNIPEMEEKQPSAFSSFLASVGSAMVENGNYREGFQLLCHAYRIKPSELNHKRNLEIAAGILTRKGLDITCEPKLVRKPR